MSKTKTFYFVPLGFDDEDRIQRATEGKIESGKAITGYMLTKSQIANRVAEGIFLEDETDFYKFKTAGKVVRKLEIKFK